MREEVQAAIEFERLDAAFDRVKAATLERIATTLPEESAKRERLYQATQVLEAVKVALMAEASGAAISDYLKSLAEAGS
jgi:hypothetical protein